jgi:uncharacterized protein
MKTRLFLILALATPATVAAQDPFPAALQAAQTGQMGQAAVIFHALAADGNGPAQYNLAVLFLNGSGVPQSTRDALYWAWRARLSGVAQAQALIAQLGETVSDDLRATTAARITADLDAAIRAGDGRAMLQLSVVLTELAPLPDLESAYIWQAISAALQTPNAAQGRDATFARLSPDARINAQDKAMEMLSGLCKAGMSGQPVCAALF